MEEVKNALNVDWVGATLFGGLLFFILLGRRKDAGAEEEERLIPDVVVDFGGSPSHIAHFAWRALLMNVPVVRRG